MAMFNSYVSLPEGIPILRPGHTKGPKGLATSFSLPIRQIWDFPIDPGWFPGFILLGLPPSLQPRLGENWWENEENEV